jgi:phage gpG-like protein
MLGVIMLPPASVLAAEFAGLSRSFKSFREPLLRSVREVMAPSLRRNFEVGGRPPWEPLADQTIDRKSLAPHRAGFVGAPLIRTGALMQAAGQINLWKIDKEAAEATGGPAYGIIHQEGWEFGPAREWAIIQPEDANKIEDVFQRWIDERLRGAGFR